MSDVSNELVFVLKPFSMYITLWREYAAQACAAGYSCHVDKY